MIEFYASVRTVFFSTTTESARNRKILFEIPTLRVALRVRLAIKLLAQDDAQRHYFAVTKKVSTEEKTRARIEGILSFYSCSFLLELFF